MAKLNYVQSQQASQQKGIIVGSLFPITKLDGFSFKWKGKVKDAKGNLVDISGKELITNLLESGCFDSDSQGRTKGMLVLKNNRKRPDKRDPDYTVLAYPSEAEVKVKTE